ncbi:MAG: O-antigen ligase family protein [Holophagales bacterium]|nr:O-antigen ligase family protein [Holophagales bacterium]
MTRVSKASRSSKGAREPEGTERRESSSPAVADGDLSGGLAALVVAATLFGVLLAVDTRAESAFDSIKTVVAHGGAVLATSLLLAGGPGPARSMRSLPPVLRIAAFLAVTGAGLALLSAVFATRPAASLDALRSAALTALLVPLGASRAFDSGRILLPVAGFLAGVSANSVASVLQAAGLVKLFDVVQITGRANTGAFLGNEGYVALVAALAVPVGAGCVAVTRGRVRWLAGAALVLALAALAANPSLTALAAATTGLGGYLYFGAPSRIRRRAIGAFLAVAAVLPLVPAARARLADLAYHVRSRNLEALLSYRAGPWAAAMEMTREHPLLGVGPGGFESRFVPARLAAEQRLRRSFVAESAAGSYAQAHSDFLQAPAELGLPAAAALTASFALLLVGLRGRIRATSSPEPAVLLGVLAAGFVAALAWFPMQRALTAAPLLLAVGRAARLSAVQDPEK